MGFLGAEREEGTDSHSPGRRGVNARRLGFPWGAGKQSSIPRLPSQGLKERRWPMRRGRMEGLGKTLSLGLRAPQQIGFPAFSFPASSGSWSWGGKGGEIGGVRSGTYVKKCCLTLIMLTDQRPGSDRNIGYTTTGDMGNTFSGCVGEKRPTKTEKVRTSYLVGRYGLAT